MQRFSERLHRASLAGARRAKQKEHAHRPVLRSETRLKHFNIGDDYVDDIRLANDLRRQNRRQIFNGLSDRLAYSRARDFWDGLSYAGLIIRRKCRIPRFWRSARKADS